MKVRVPEGAKREAPDRAGRRRGTLRCPQCHKHRLSPELAFIGGAKYYCADCGFRGALVITYDEETEADARKAREG